MHLQLLTSVFRKEKLDLVKMDSLLWDLLNVSPPNPPVVPTLHETAGASSRIPQALLCTLPGGQPLV